MKKYHSTVATVKNLLDINVYAVGVKTTGIFLE